MIPTVWTALPELPRTPNGKLETGKYVLWFLLVLAAGKILATSLTLGVGGSGVLFGPPMFIGAISSVAFGEIASHVIGPAAVACVVEMTGAFALTLPCMLTDVPAADSATRSGAWRPATAVTRVRFSLTQSSVPGRSDPI
jgi:H+/Cl- antiporter ClcA